VSFLTKVIVNPCSGNGATQKRWPELRGALDGVLGGSWDDVFTQHSKHAVDLARAAVQADYEMLVGIGGDGTTSEIVTGLFEADPIGISDTLIRPGIVLGPVRAGTGGDFARARGLTHKLPGAVTHLSGTGTTPCDLGLLEYTTHEGQPARTAFLNITSFGLSGMVDQKVNGSSKAFGGTTSFLIGLGKALAAYRPASVRIKVDDKEFYAGKLVTCAVANSQYFGGGMKFAPNAEIDDGQFDVVVQTATGLREYLSIRDVYTGKMQDWATVRNTRGRVIEALPDQDDPVLLDVDGEQLGRLPARLTIVPSAIRLKTAL
jgi:YegS/Rv2252/BmrU family lipid kinase